MAAVRALRLKLGLTLAQSCSVLTHDEWIVCVAHTKNGESIEPSAAAAAAVFTATVASVMRGVRVAALLQCGGGGGASSCRHCSWCCLPLCSSRQFLFLCYGGLAARGAPSGGRNCKFVVVAASSLATAATSGYVRNGFINWLNVTFIELQPLHYHCRRQV